VRGLSADEAVTVAVSRVLCAWASPEINRELTTSNVGLLRDWLMGAVQPPSEPEVSAETLSALGLPRRRARSAGVPTRDSEPTDAS
jgi:hypothetical protein